MSDKTAEMWAAMAAYQPTADDDGHGDSWRVMCKKRTEESMWAAYDATPEGSAAKSSPTAWVAWVAPTASSSAASAAEWADKYAQAAIDALKGVQP